MATREKWVGVGGGDADADADVYGKRKGPTYGGSRISLQLLEKKATATCER